MSRDVIFHIKSHALEHGLHCFTSMRGKIKIEKDFFFSMIFPLVYSSIVRSMSGTIDTHLLLFNFLNCMVGSECNFQVGWINIRRWREFFLCLILLLCYFWLNLDYCYGRIVWRIYESHLRCWFDAFVMQKKSSWYIVANFFL